MPTPIKHFALKDADGTTFIPLTASTKKGVKGASGVVDPEDPPARLELLQTGMWDTPYHGMFMITDEDLQEYIDNNAAGLRSGLPIDYEHDEDGGAAGWIKTLNIAPSSRGDGSNALWGDVEWTPEAIQQIKDGVYKYFSPEFWPECYPDPETGELFDNVFIGGGLTNRSLFKQLTPVRASDKGKVAKKGLTAAQASSTIYVRKAQDMNLKDLLAKKPADLSDEEKAFVVEHKGELDEAQVTSLTEAGVLEAETPAADEPAGDEPAADEPAADEPAADDGTKGGEKKTVAISATELAKLQKQAADGAAALDILNEKKASETIQGMLFNDKGGHFPPVMADDLTKFYRGLSASQKTAFEELVNKMPKANLFEIRGGDSPVGAGAYDDLKKLAEDKVTASDGKLNFATAMKQARDENPELSQRYLAEVEGRA